ncbi:MAG: hypothetical protein ACI87O_002562 [Planctomycetota bacterium]|jgi:hypothetical protein
MPHNFPFEALAAYFDAYRIQNIPLVGSLGWREWGWS